jgi:hypothetical protein
MALQVSVFTFVRSRGNKTMSNLPHTGAFIATNDGESIAGTKIGNEPCCFVNIKVTAPNSNRTLFAQNLLIDQSKVDILLRENSGSTNIKNIHPFVNFFESIMFPGLHMDNFAPKYIKAISYNLVKDNDFTSKLALIVENAV